LTLEVLEDRAVPSNLLVNGDFSLGNTGFTSQYTYSTDLGPEGNYVVGADPQTYNSGGASFGDHTTGTGLMLIANGDPTPNTYVWQETVNVSNTTTYSFSGWAASWGELGNNMDPSPAQLEFFVNGVQIGSEFTLNAEDGEWSQFAASWNSGTSSVATIAIVDMNTTAVGNDFALDDLAFGVSAATQLAITTQPPASIVSGSGFGLAVTVEDQFGAVFPTYSGTVTVALSSNPGAATLGGILTATVQNGVATFSGLTLNEPGIGYTLEVSSSGLTSATTSALNVQTTVASSVGVNWGTAGSATLETAADGVRLLPAGRNTDLPWMGINKLSITLAQPTTLAPGDVTVVGSSAIDYGPVTISGSGTSYTITLAQPINAADRVTITIGNDLIATYSRQLDVLPGDANDDGVVNVQDMVAVRNQMLGIMGAAPTIFGDINGDGNVNINDYTLVHDLIGTALPSNLLVNGDFSRGNTGFTSQYTYSTDLGPEGNYVVGADPQTYNSGGASFGDHTTGNGLMLIANGAPTPNTYVWQETVNVLNATNYTFSGWAASWGELGNNIDPSPAQLEFFVNGVQIGSEFTLNAEDGQWSQFTASWNSGTSSVATITIVDMNTTPVGNDFALDDLAFGPH
jgi:hypothetical protein